MTSRISNLIGNLACALLAAIFAVACSQNDGSETASDAPLADDERRILRSSDMNVDIRNTPMSAELVQELDRLKELMEAGDFAALRSTHNVWLERREQHCAATGAMAANDKEAENKVAECREGTDAQHLQSLRDLHFPLLVEAPAPRPSTKVKPAKARDLRPSKHVMALGLIHSANILLAASAPTVTALDFEDADPLYTFDANERSNTNLAISPNGKLLVTGSRHDSVIKFWDAETGTFLNEIDTKLKDAKFAFLMDGKHMVIGAKRLQVLDLRSGYLRPVHLSSGGTSAIAVNDRYVVVGTKGSEIVPYSMRYSGGSLELKPEGRGTAGVRRSIVAGLSLSADGLHMISVTRSGVIDKWTVPDMEKVQSTHSELAYVGYMTSTARNEIIFVSGNTAERGARGMVLAIDVDGRVSKKLYEQASTNSPAVQLNETAKTLVVGDGSLIRYIPVATNRKSFGAMESLGVRDLAGVQGDPMQSASAASTLGIQTGPQRRSARTSFSSALEGIAPEATVHAVGVYEGEMPNGEKRGFQEHKQGQVTVNVGGSGKAVLILTAYEPVKWIIRPRGVIVEQILLFGYYEQEVVAPPGARVYSNLQASVDTSRIYAYKRDDKYKKLVQAVLDITGKEITTFQGTYKTASFSLNVSSGSDVQARSSNIKKWVDEDGVVHYGDARGEN